MRIHALRISAFGPFAGTEDIDFDRLSAHGLFLLNGPTGAGKTSVLDAICFALYGSVPGARQDGKRLRSDHAEPGQEPAVTCEFSAQGRRFEVTRSPAWDKPSARGKNGFTTQQAKTLLRERVGGAWQEKSTRNDEAGAEILALLGMDREQFTRVVMLPQGDFAAFLRSKASDRLELLQKLFGTQRFESLEQELSRQAQAAKESVTALTARLGVLFGRAESEAAALELATEDAPAAETAERLEWLTDAVEDRLGELTKAASAAGTASTARAAEVEAEAARQDRRARLEAADVRAQAVHDSAAQLASQLERLDRHRQAEVLAAHLQGVDSAAAKVAGAASAAESALTLLRLAAAEDPELARLELDQEQDLEQAGRSGTAPLSGATAELGRLRSLLAVVEARVPDEDRLRELRTRHTTLAGRHNLAGKALADLDSREVRLGADRSALMAGLPDLELRAGAEPLLSKEAAAAGELLDVVRRHAAALTDRTAVHLRYEQAREVRLETKREWLDLREARLANAAAELAAHLLPGSPCPVCGSGEHPLPAASGHGGPGLAQAEEAAQQEHEAAEAAFVQVSRELSDADQKLAVLVSQGGDTQEEQARQDAHDAREAARAARDAAAELATKREELAKTDDAIAATAKARAATEAELAQAATELAGLAEQTETLDQALLELRNGHRSLPQRLRALEKSAAVLAKALDGQERLDRTRAAAAEAAEQLEQALPGAGFSSPDEARERLLAGAEAASLQAQIRAAQDEAARVAELFASPDLVQAREEQAAGPGAGTDGLLALRGAAAAAREEARQADLAAGLAGRCLAALQAMGTEYAELTGAARGPAERAQMLAGLADAAAGRGENTYRMSLNSYVLAARLEQVALAASERLVAMSDGRYLLQHTDAKAARGAKSGLGLEVVDQWTGFRRDTSTLSGGESFMASLSLALGLADVVQQEAGGVEIETLFVDEGFGSLDEQSLEQVMDALEGLRDGGRVVGLVSHVGEMKQRIGTQLQVIKARTGSTLRITDALDLPG